MKKTRENTLEDTRRVYPEFHKIIQRSDKERFLKQRSRVLWLTGLSGSGKTTLGSYLEKELFSMGYMTQMLDGDNIRSGINCNLSFTGEDRRENIRRIAEVSKLFLNCGIIVISCFISPTNEIRAMAKKIIGPGDFLEVYVNAPLEICEQRDVKGLYKLARNGKIRDFTGIDSPFEAPLNCNLEIRTDQLTVEESVQQLLNFVLPQIRNGR
ncbi:MAG TPA: adenylyl-sulfate kinase [Bacteroidales bacterium]|nr:adenylyl-sulfate kinase [Bacteroidales bacterium]HNS47707.1 adenylyl-sulfate kinase [Bacteroidales bacterium]